MKNYNLDALFFHYVVNDDSYSLFQRVG